MIIKVCKGKKRGLGKGKKTKETFFQFFFFFFFFFFQGGSGFFSESANDTIPLTMNDRLLTLASPSQPAVVEVKVEDGCLGGSNPAYSVVHFSDIQRFLIGWEKGQLYIRSLIMFLL